MFPSAVPWGNIEILGKQNELFPSRPVIKCLNGGNQEINDKHNTGCKCINTFINLLLIGYHVLVVYGKQVPEPKFH